MRKLTLVMILMIATFTLYACDKGPVVTSGDIKVQIADEFITDDTLEIHAVIPYSFESLDDLHEVALTVISQSYEKHFDQIGTSTYTMTIYFYKSADDFDSDKATYGTMVFDINKDVENPGLTLKTNSLKN